MASQADVTFCDWPGSDATFWYRSVSLAQRSWKGRPNRVRLRRRRPAASP